ncbi:hypothetical protein LJ656_24305 [Paraburkholderia sp. MMS20-SJTR3]|uniref:Uncharacterized protein n=1 Tax=Paraburkholderia sejongensis TaxID=2886946 RepID=A0ABS8K0M8_9BURK|nr:hypothetical protein [Paraburkholderia sp. MMS20-SJTR3]MCC8395710.1 hypothetical protein [Paraburkholderia sp. MMS20-SJTR3]
MRFRSYLAAGAAALLPALALAGQPNAQPAEQAAAQPLFISVNGQAVPVKTETRVVQTASGPLKISTWSWRSPQGGASVAMQSGTTSVPPELALRQMQAMQAMQYQMRAAQMQMIAMQQQMQRQMIALQHAALAGAFATPTPHSVVFAAPVGAAPQQVIILNPLRRSAPPAPAPAPAVPAKGPEIKV